MPDQSVQQSANGILGKTLGEVLQNNDHAQGMIMKAMQITPQQFQEMFQKTGSNQLMNMTIGDLFKNGVVQQATGQPQPLSPDQVDTLMQGEQVVVSNPEALTQTPVPKQSFIDKVKSFFS